MEPGDRGQAREAHQRVGLARTATSVPSGLYPRRAYQAALARSAATARRRWTPAWAAWDSSAASTRLASPCLRRSGVVATSTSSAWGPTLRYAAVATGASTGPHTATVSEPRSARRASWEASAGELVGSAPRARQASRWALSSSEGSPARIVTLGAETAGRGEATSTSWIATTYPSRATRRASPGCASSMKSSANGQSLSSEKRARSARSCARTTRRRGTAGAASTASESPRTIPPMRTSDPSSRASVAKTRSGHLGPRQPRQPTSSHRRARRPSLATWGSGR